MVKAPQHWVFFHGFMGSQREFAHLAMTLPGQTTCVTLVGHGDHPATDPAAYNMWTQTETWARWLREQPAPVTLVGYSMGGRLALGLALRYPEFVQHLVLESSSPGLASVAAQAQRQAHDQALAQQLLANGLPAFAQAWARLPLFASQQRLPLTQQHRIQQQRQQHKPVGLVNSLRYFGTGQQPNLWPALPYLTVPTTLIVGALDPKFQQISQQMAALLPQAKRFVVPAAGHNVHLEQPAAYQAILEAQTGWN
ncbi:2-succinyl-6-hydroxy-2,4-cyclohexadiene-1-carboxylate synthase [Loigolactobacillus bifermentans]|uniref:Putative 2-succinyl-6-hydroxy-2,4-cyclohexadiene-1-carboxylate synthase n=1 Tax=Loigolactobacillus bifermentans DSM 20003 TaxID=1423726 RepID=A0A0R1GW19_9LACO|nr:2-succinyl-6-hydroxy-2,4-cyclohexadiene-1-carboxylate synthase [Loigolactobacillus bifermentans]KRK35402.1 alpha beta superfamily hydrolase acyltransferase [Loigolactobacillus bifermentans DSM 20003]QGG60390.1 2-succinyl-6-hydroxy-2,4-cyclohexadiene-1-carboxylate synthase [Loigolactobacillus bifermentans]